MSKQMNRYYDNGTDEYVTCPATTRVCVIESKEIQLKKRSRKERKAYAKRSDKAGKFMEGFEQRTNVRSTTEAVLEQVRQEGWFPHSMGGTSGLTKTIR